MIKLIASDLDGTLLKNGAQDLTQEAQEWIRRLLEKEVLFVAASGRQYPNLERLFKGLSPKMGFICENGAYTFCCGKEISAIFMDRELGLAIMEDIYERDDCEILLSGKNTSYLQPKTEAYEYRMKYVVKNNVKVVEDIRSVTEPYLKISACQPSGIHHSSSYFMNKWGERAQVVVSGEMWLDFTRFGVNKGAALSRLQNDLCITAEETVVFGDNFNDIEMFSCAKRSYVMESASEEIHRYGTHRTRSVEEELEKLYYEI